MRIDFSVTLPADVRSVPFIRGLCRQALEQLDADEGVVIDITLALTEACANVVKHSRTSDAFLVAIALDEEVCRIAVSDSGEGFDVTAVGTADGSLLESGRGVAIMKRLSDELSFSNADGRHQVAFERRLSGGTLRLV